jgi:putative ABC transport system ATP-binding protein
LLADEPTGNLDSANGEAIMQMLRELHQAGATILMVTHDPRFVHMANRLVHMLDGKLQEGARTEA